LDGKNIQQSGELLRNTWREGAADRHLPGGTASQLLRLSTLCDRPQYGASRMVTLHPMTNDSLELIAAARRGAEKAWRDGYAYTKAGIMLDDLLPEDELPHTLFEEDTAKRDRLMGALDAINASSGLGPG
jgi:hypothetical protein